MQRNGVRSFYVKVFFGEGENFRNSSTPLGDEGEVGKMDLFCGVFWWNGNMKRDNWAIE